ncbi:MAG: glycosyltransferase, partial [Coriobacteriaceae bacterium]|nr:glycosyltransferase [Coriobacteriaceae bacterium]
MAADKASRPAVSVVVPVYNVEGYLRECLDSLCAQTLGDLEVVCVDDGSTDGSLALIREYAARDPRIAVFTKPNSGYGASMNQGIARAHGEYIGILESDDFIEPAAFEVLYRAAKEHDAEAVKANYFYYWSKPQPKSELVPSIDAGLAGFGDPREKTGVFSLAPAVWSALYRRDFLEENGIRFLETPGASYQDASFNFKVWACARRAVFLEEAFVHYRQDNESSSVNSKEKVYCVCDEYAEMQRFLDGRPEVKERLQGILVWMKFTSYWWNYGR